MSQIIAYEKRRKGMCFGMEIPTGPFLPCSTSPGFAVNWLQVQLARKIKYQFERLTEICFYAKSFKFVPNPQPLSVVFFGGSELWCLRFPHFQTAVRREENNGDMSRPPFPPHSTPFSLVLPFLHPIESPRAGVQAFSQDWFIGVLLTKACNSAVGFSRELQLAQSMEPFRALSISFVSRGPWMPHKKTHINDHRLGSCTQSHNTVYCNAWAHVPFVRTYTGAETIVKRWAKLVLRTRTKLPPCLCRAFTVRFQELDITATLWTL